jgi:GT2 family glycosyltransferase/glycosyltransferase involved in cell wall biosynthesis
MPPRVAQQPVDGATALPGRRLHQHTPGQALPPIVKVVGYLRSEKGVGEAARATIRALRMVGIATRAEVIHDPTSEERYCSVQESEGGSAQINIFHINPKELLHLRERLVAERAMGHRTIGYWAWELPELPVGWTECLSYLTEVWTPSTFVSQAVARAASIPVFTFPHCLDIDQLQPDCARTRAGAFRFFFAFDYLSDMTRKNPLGVIEAFRRAFTPRDPVELVIKSMHSSFDPDGAAAIRSAAAGVRVRIIDEIMSRTEVLRLFKNCHGYVSLHRAEGFGLMLAEAMALGKPVIATGYSGNIDFMTPENSLLVNHSLVEVGDGHGDYEPHQQWAEPDLDHAALLLRALVQDPRLAARIGARAREDVVRSLHPAKVGAQIRDHLVLVDRVTAPRHAPPDVRCSIVMPVYGKAELTRACLRSLLYREAASHLVEIVVVDDASPDETSGMLGEFGDRIRVLSHSANLGFGQSCNDGAAAARSEILVFLNNDTIPRSGWLDALVGYADAHPEAGIVGAKLLYPEGGVQHAGVVICTDRRPRHLYRGFPEMHPAVSVSRRFQVVTAACMLIHRRLFARLGGFDAAFRNGFEDVDLCLRAGEMGAEVHYCAESVVEHLESATRRGRPDEELRNFQLYWDRWAHRVIPDELTYYCADGLLRIKQVDRYPLEFDISTELGMVSGKAVAAGAPGRRDTLSTRGLVASPMRPRAAPPRLTG